MSSIERQIETDLVWREQELVTLKLLAARESSDHVRHAAILRALVAMLYAHYEGFCRFCWELFLTAIKTNNPEFRHLTEEMRQSFAEATLKKMRNATSRELLEFLICYDSFLRLRISELDLPKIDTESNLWPSLVQSINAGLGLKCELLANYTEELRALVGRRNGIAHGEKLTVPTLSKYAELEKGTLLVMHELAIAVLEALNGRLYIVDRYR